MVNLPDINGDPQAAWQSGFLSSLQPSPVNLDTTGATAIQKRQQQNEGYAAAPLSSPAAASAMASINAQAQRRAASAKGQAISNAANSGSAGFAGALQNTGAGIEEQKNTDITTAQGDLAAKLGTQYSGAADQLAGQYSTAVSQQNSQKLQQSQQTADEAARKAQLQQQEEMQRYANIMEQARIAESARQFDAGLPLQQANTQLAQQQLALYQQGLSSLNSATANGGGNNYSPFPQITNMPMQVNTNPIGNRRLI